MAGKLVEMPFGTSAFTVAAPDDEFELFVCSQLSDEDSAKEDALDRDYHEEAVEDCLPEVAIMASNESIELPVGVEIVPENTLMARIGLNPDKAGMQVEFW